MRRRGLLLVIIVLHSIAGFVYNPFITPHLKTLGATATLIGLVVGVYGAVQIVTTLPMGIGSDLLGRKKPFVIIGCLLVGLSGTVMLLGDSPYWILLGKFLCGLGNSPWVTIVTLYLTYCKEGDSAKAIGVANAVSYIGMLIGYLLSGILMEWTGIKIAFALSMVSGLTAFVLSLFIQEEEPQKRAEAGSIQGRLKDVLRACRGKSLICAFVLGVIMTMGTQSTVQSFTANVISDQLGAKGIDLALNTSIYTIACIFGSFAVGLPLFRRLRREKVVSLAFLLLAGYCIVFTYCPSLFFAYLLQAFAGFGAGVGFPILSAVSIEDAAPNQKTASMAAYQLSGSAGVILGPTVMGVLVDRFDYRISYFCIAALCLAGLVLTQYLSRKKMFR